jgi:PAS domain S-box-containing protein/putative nucleotidyltransferase with HDIG domain
MSDTGKPKRTKANSKRDLGVPQPKDPRRKKSGNIENFKALADSANDMVLVVPGLDEKYVYTNRRAAEMTGYTVKEILNMSLNDLVYPDDVKFIRERFKKRLAGEKVPNTFEVRIAKKNGEPLPVEVTSAITSWFGRPAALNIIRDVSERKKLEAAIQGKKAIENFKHLADSIVDGFGVAAKEGRFVYVNDQLAIMTGYTINELGSMTLENLFPAKERKLIRARHAKRIKGDNPPQVYETAITRKNGEIVPIEVTVAKTVWHGQPAVFGILRDITERKKNEARILEQQALLQAFTESSRNPIFSVDKRYRYTSFNRVHAGVMKALYGVEIELGKPLSDFMTVKKDWLIAKTNLDKALKGERITEEAFSGDDALARSYFTVTHDPIVEEGRGIVGVAIRALDITERRRLELEVARERDMAQKYLDVASVIVVVLTKSGNVKMINRYGANLLGYSVEEIVGKNWFNNFIPASGQKTVKQVFRKIMQGKMKGVDKYDNEIMTKDGSSRTVSWNNINITGDDGKIIETMSSGMDITDRKRADEEKARAYEKLMATLEGTVNALSATTEHRDPYTSGHQERVTKLSCAIAEEVGLAPEMREDIRIAGRLHDIGKMEIPAEILSKPSKLADIEFSMVKIHSQAGHDILKVAKLPSQVARIVLEHHERLDGSGYPNGLTADDITDSAKILAVADVVEAMVSHRPYRSALGLDAALEEIEKNRGKLYDPDAVDACLKLFREKGFAF